jgi:hypothetical protein
LGGSQLGVETKEKKMWATKGRAGFGWKKEPIGVTPKNVAEGRIMMPVFG